MYESLLTNLTLVVQKLYVQNKIILKIGKHVSNEGKHVLNEGKHVFKSKSYIFKVFNLVIFSYQTYITLLKVIDPFSKQISCRIKRSI